MHPLNIKIAKQGGVVRLTLDRPKHNMLNIEMLKELISQLETQAGDVDMKCLVILGEGPSWCAGLDLGGHRPEVMEELIVTLSRLFELMDKIEVPTIAAVHGACLGGGMEIAIACDMIIAAKSSIFSQPEIKFGFLPPYAAIRLPKLVGPAKAMEICLTGKRYSADEARIMGFVSKVMDDDKLAEGLEKLIGEIATSSPCIIRLNKLAIKQNLEKPFPHSLQGAEDIFINTLMKTEDMQEGIMSYFEKRKPDWKNR